MEGVKDADGESFAHHVADLVLGCPMEVCDFVVDHEVATSCSAAENEGNDTTDHVLVDTGESQGLVARK
ncbi:hypothetical protein ACTMTI_05560 [Nonomuraea sp. H19]|uniref:hypothetical protein n=1 Tax=Nonomuraea sp. H19 TaxID=3452206 RepID=UPI003F8AD5E4